MFVARILSPDRRITSINIPGVGAEPQLIPIARERTISEKFFHYESCSVLAHLSFGEVFRNYKIENIHAMHLLPLEQCPIHTDKHIHISLSAIDAQQTHYVRPAKGRMFRGFKSLPATVTPAGSTLE